MEKCRGIGGIFKALDELDMVALYKDVEKEDEYYLLYVVKRPYEDDLNVPKEEIHRKLLSVLIGEDENLCVTFAKIFAELNDENKEIARKLIKNILDSQENKKTEQIECGEMSKFEIVKRVTQIIESKNVTEFEFTYKL